MDIKKKVKKLPLSCGVYIMKSARGEIFYVGKATSLKKRVGSYFSHTQPHKNATLLTNVADIDFIECKTPQQALILEAALIKEKKPKYNISLRDNKSYPYIEVTREKFARIFVSRPKKKTNSLLFGPYPVSGPLKPALDEIRKIFPYRTCKTIPKSACLFFHLSVCPAPCIGKITVSDYKTNVKSICKILKGERKSLARQLKSRMNTLSNVKKFEEAAKLRDKLSAIDSLYKGKPKEHEIISLKKVLNLSRIPLHIEAVDISSLGKQDCVGSLVVFKDGAPSKNNYRRFLIKQANKKDDYDMSGEVLRRRYARSAREKRKLPDLVIIDGGKGHVERAYKELNTLGIFIPLIGISKRYEQVWFPNKKLPLCIPKTSSSLHLIQRIRDEAHRFAHAYQLVRRKKTMMKK